MTLIKRRMLKILTTGLALGCALVCLRTNGWAGETNTPATNASPAKWTSTSALKEKWSQRPAAELRVTAEKGDPEAQYLLGFQYATGGTTNYAEAERWFRKAADQNFGLAQNGLGALYENGLGTPQNLGEAIQWYRRAADQGVLMALNNLGQLAYSGQAPGLKRQDCIEFYEKAAQSGDLAAATALGRLQFKPLPGRSGDPGTGLHWLSYAANHGWVDAYADVAWLYMDGHFVERDYAEAQKWFADGAEKGDARCLLGLGMHELIAHSDAPDLAKARGWLLKSAEAGNVVAHFQLGRLSELQNIAHSPEVTPNYEEAAKWYQQAADQGFNEAAARLAELTMQGRVGKTGDSITRLQRASDLGHLGARLELVRCYARGEGKPRNAAEEPATLLQSLVDCGKPKAMIEMADWSRTGRRVPKDPLHALFLLQLASAPALYDEEATMRLADLKRAVDTKTSPSKNNEGLESVYRTYRKAFMTPAAAVQIGRGYLDGTYPTNQLRACAWLSLAVENGDKTVTAERDQLMQKLDDRAKSDAQEYANCLRLNSRLAWPGE
jgi:TPR repeat protein